VWDVAEKALYWIDGGAPAIYRLDPKTNDIKSWQTPKPIGSFALREKGGAVLALADGFYLFDFESGEAQQIGEPAAKPGTTFNDGKTDARGRFIAGTLDSKFAQPIGSIFSLDVMYATSIGEKILGMEPGAEGGSLFAIKGLDVKGKPEPRFAG
jgi:L-arabinonolactonase